MTGGHFRYTVPNESIQPVTFTPPSMKTGCGGIDVSMGSMGYLSMDYLGKKLQTILQSSGALAFQLAISEYAKDINNLLNSLDQISNVINLLNTNSCTIAKSLMGYGGNMLGISAANASNDSQTDTFFEKMRSGISNVNSTVTDFLNKGDMLYDCQIKFSDKNSDAYKMCVDSQNTYAYFPSGIWNAVLVNSNNYKTFFADILRAYYGDFYNKSTEPSNLTTLDPCEETVGGIKDLIMNPNRPYVSRSLSSGNSTCTTQSNDTTLYNKVQGTLNSMASKIKSGDSLSTDEISIVESTNLPIFALMSRAVLVDRLSVTADSSAQEHAVSQFTEYIVSEVLYRAFSSALNMTRTYVNLKKLKDTTSGATIEALKSMHDTLEEDMRDINEAYNSNRKEKMDTWNNFNGKIKELNTIIASELSKQKLMDNVLFGNAIHSMK